ncbi:MAG TPA: alpha-mannosidase, partial [Clostridiaceae bacterium]|nr:alpha-mannosidase [Clostridiaceae bacterium]
MEGKKDTGYIVSHTHWDREWRYPLWKSRMMLVQFMKELLDILDTDPDYKNFVMDGQSVVFEDYLEVRPEDRERIIKYIKEGRISIGPWYTLPDLYPVDGESLIRNLLKGIRFSESLGGYLKVGYNSFGWGQTTQFPQIYKGFGFDVIVAAKNVSKERAPESEFLWEAPDGTRVLTTRLGQHARANFYMNAYIPIMHGMDYLSDDYRYVHNKSGLVYHQADEKNFFNDHFMLHGNRWIHDEVLKEAIQKAWDGTEETTLKSHRILMNGSDFTVPQRELTEIIRRANELFEDKIFVHSTFEEYTNKLKELVNYEKLKVVRGELRDGPASSCSSNALATRSHIKRLNRKVENSLLHNTEPLSVIGSMAGIEYQKEFIDLAIKYMLLSHPHDSINGVTQDKTAEDTVNRLNQALEISETVSETVCGELIKKINLSRFDSRDVILVAVNPSPAVQRHVVKVYVDIPQEYNIWDFDIENCHGNRMDKQLVSRKEVVVPVHDPDSRPWPFYADRFCFYMDTGDIPACGYKVFKIVPKSSFNRKTVFWPEMRKSKGNDIASSVNTMENEYLKVKVEKDGTISIMDKSDNKLYSNLNYFEDAGDCGDYWVYYPPYNNRIYTSKGSPARIWLEDNGPLSATIGTEIKMKVPAYAHRPENAIKGESCRSEEESELTITCHYTLKKGSKRVDVRLVVDNTAEDHRLRLMFDTGIKAEYSDAAGHFTVDRRPVSPVRDEKGEYYPEMQTLPMQSFVDISDGNTGFAVLSNSFFEYEAMNNMEGTIAITLFRSVRNIICTEFRSAGVFVHEKGGQSLGKQEYEYSIYPHKGNWREAEVYAEAEKFMVPP